MRKKHYYKTNALIKEGAEFLAHQHANFECD